MKYTVTRQHQWDTGNYVVEISGGGIDYCNPDALGKSFPGEFEEFEDVREAVDTAIQIAEQWNGKLKVVKLDIDDNPDITMRYQVMGVPTLALFVNGTLKERITGYQPKDRIISKLSPHIG